MKKWLIPYIFNILSYIFIISLQSFLLKNIDVYTEKVYVWYADLNVDIVLTIPIWLQWNAVWMVTIIQP